MYAYFFVPIHPYILWIKAKGHYSQVVGFCCRMAWLGLTSSSYESLKVVEPARNHGHHFSLDDDEALLKSLGKRGWGLPSYRWHGKTSIKLTTYSNPTVPTWEHTPRCADFEETEEIKWTQAYFGVGDVGQDVSFLLCAFYRIFSQKEERHFSLCQI